MNFFNQFTPEQMRRQYAKNAEQLRQMQAVAERNGKCNGYTAAQLADKATEFERKAETLSK